MEASLIFAFWMHLTYVSTKTYTRVVTKMTIVQKFSRCWYQRSADTRIRIRVRFNVRDRGFDAVRDQTRVQVRIQRNEFVQILVRAMSVSVDLWLVPADKRLKFLVSKIAQSILNIWNLQPTYAVFNSYFQHRCWTFFGGIHGWIIVSTWTWIVKICCSWFSI